MELGMVIGVFLVGLLNTVRLERKCLNQQQQVEQARNQLIAAIKEGGRGYQHGYEHALEVAIVNLQSTTTETVAAIANVLMVELRGDVDSPVNQPTVPKEGNIHDPEWTMWDEANIDPQDFGVGDSVYVDRSFAGEVRVAGIKDGESIIPGVPMPDMSGEKFNG